MGRASRRKREEREARWQLAPQPVRCSLCKVNLLASEMASHDRSPQHVLLVARWQIDRVVQKLFGPPVQQHDCPMVLIRTMRGDW